ncbi:MAG: hypothetical protein Fur005_03970 [Roseiflexaceae bacterium]
MSILLRLRRPAVAVALLLCILCGGLLYATRRAALGPLVLAPILLPLLAGSAGALFGLLADPSNSWQQAWRRSAPVLLPLPLLIFFSQSPLDPALTLLIGVAGVVLLCRMLIWPPASLDLFARLRWSLIGIALIGFGLASSAGVLAGGYALLCHAVGCAESNRLGGWQKWLLAGIIPGTGLFVAFWLAIGAAAAAGVPLLAGGLWLLALIWVLEVLATSAPAPPPRTLDLSGWAILVIGIGSPAFSFLLLQPLVDQVQAGLSPYGNLSIQPWIGIALLDSGSRAAVTAPLSALPLLLLVLLAVGRLFGPPDSAEQEQP